MKYVILVGDGMGDRPLSELQARTPLEAAATPAMDSLCRQGQLRLLRTIPEGYQPGSDVANLSLMGYRPEDVYTGRAPLEAASMGVQLDSDELAFRCNLVTLEHNSAGQVKMIDFSAGHITTDEARELIQSLSQELACDEFQLYPGVSYRHLMVYRGDAGELATVPPHDYIGKDVSFAWQAYGKTLLMPFIDRASVILADHPVNAKRQAKGLKPANGIWLWGEGKTPTLQSLRDAYGISGALISAVDLLKGIGTCAGLEIINVEGATGYLDTNYQGKVDAALDAAKRHDFVFVHVEAPDEAGHEGDLTKKLQAIEDFDARIVAPVFAGLQAQGEPFRLVVAMDHFTPIEIMTHSEEPVPVILFDSQGAWPASGLDYQEKNGAQAGAVLQNGAEFFELLIRG